MIALHTIADLLISAAMISFTIAEFKQFNKIKRTQTTLGISLTHYYFKAIAITATTIAYGILCLHISFTFAFIELVLIYGATIMVKIFRSNGQ